MTWIVGKERSTHTKTHLHSTNAFVHVNKQLLSQQDKNNK